MFRYFSCPGCSRAFIFPKADEGKSLQCTYCDKVSKTEVTPLGVDTVIGHHYQLKQVIEQRDLGHTYMAQNMKDDTACQVMLFVSDFSDNITDVNEFRYFITAASKICAPAHIQIADSGVDEDICFIVWDHPDTESLHHVVERAGGLPPIQAATACREIALSLSNAWRVSSFPHLNLSPDCIYVDNEGKIYLHDFGITYFLFQDHKFLDADFPLLSPKFVSPALAIGQENVDYHSDIYSLGAVFYFMMLGHPPFPNIEDPVEILRSPLLLSESEMLTTGPAMSALLQRMLSKTPEDEFDDWAQVLDAFDAAIGEARELSGKKSKATPTVRVRAVLPNNLGLEFGMDGKPKFAVKSSGEKVVLPPRSPRSTGRFSIEDSIEKLSAYPKQKVEAATAQKLYKTQPRASARQTAFRRQATKTDMSMIAMERQVTHTQALQRAKEGTRSTAALVWAVLILVAVVVGLVVALFVRRHPSVTGEASAGQTPVEPVRQVRMNVVGVEAEKSAATPKPGGLLAKDKGAAGGMEVEPGDAAVVAAKARGATSEAVDAAGLGALWKKAEALGEINQENYEVVVAAFRDVAKQAARAGNTELRMHAVERIAELEAKKAMGIAGAKRDFEARVSRLVEDGKFDEALALCDNSKPSWATEYGHERLMWRKKITGKTGDTGGGAKAAPIQGQVAEVERLVAETLAGARVAEARELLVKVADEEEKVHGDAYTNFVRLLDTCTPEALLQSLHDGLKAKFGEDGEYEMADGTLVGLRVVARKGEDLQVIQHAGDGEVKKIIPISSLSARQRLKYIRADEPGDQALRQAIYAQQEGAFDDALKALDGYTGFLGGDMKEQFPKAARTGRETQARRLLDESLRTLGFDPEANATELISRISKTAVTAAQAETITKNLTVLAQDLPNTEVYTQNRILIAAFQVHVARFLPKPEADVTAEDVKAKAEKKMPRLATVGVEGGAPLLEDAVKRLKPGQTLRLDPATYSEKMKIMTPEVTIDGSRGAVLKEEIVIYKEKVTLKNLFLKGSSVRIVSGVNGVTLENCVVDGGAIEFGGKHQGVTISNSRMHGLVLREVSDLFLNHCTVLASTNGRDRQIQENEESAIVGDFDGKVMNSIIYSPDGVALSLDGSRRSRLSFSCNLIYGKVALALLKTPKGLVSVTNLKDFERQIGRGAQFVTSEPQFANPDQGNYKLSVTSPGAKACKDGLDMGMLTDDENWPIHINDARRSD